MIKVELLLGIVLVAGGAGIGAILGLGHRQAQAVKASCYEAGFVDYDVDGYCFDGERWTVAPGD